jgi:hypothetical protein
MIIPGVTDTPEVELATLRVSLARVAQILGVDNQIGVTGKNYQMLCVDAVKIDRGWNNLAAVCMDEIERLKDIEIRWNDSSAA